MTVGAAAGEARDVLDRGNAPVQAAPTVPTTNARRDSRVASIMELEAHIRELPFSVAVLGIEVATFGRLERRVCGLHMVAVETDCMAGHVRLEPANPSARYLIGTT
jgi:hypothetical protein